MGSVCILFRYEGWLSRKSVLFIANHVSFLDYIEFLLRSFAESEMIVEVKPFERGTIIINSDDRKILG